MNLKLNVNSNEPPTEVLIVAEIITSQNKNNVTVSWLKEWKEQGNACLYDNGKLLATNYNDINRYFARTLDDSLYGGSSPLWRTEVDHWISFSLGQLVIHPLKESSLEYLDHVLLTQTWLVNKSLTLADIHVFCALLNMQFLETCGEKYHNINRWYNHVLSHDAVEKTLSLIAKNRPLCKKVQVKTVTEHKEANTRKQEGKFVDLPGAEMGKVVVRFPPEASGYLHIGHAKAALLNQYYAEAFKGQFIMRFDDTNPAKETVEFEEAILEDLKLLQIKPDRFTHTSDYFDLLEEYCTTLIKNGLAFVDDTPAQLMKEQREQKLKSNNRDNSVEKNLMLWDEMRRATEKGQECCVRAKIDYESVNGCLRDPTIYRCKSEPHPRTGDKYKVYPTYDFACPIVDSIENVTHTLRTTEYRDRDLQFFWILEALGLRKPYIWEYSRLNMTHTVLSKRKLTWFVNEFLVDGWDDPRFPTVRGILRRGMTVEALKQFIIAQGSSKSVVFMQWDKIWAINKKVIDPIATRYTALDYDDVVLVNVVDAKEDWLTVQNHPKDPSKGTKRVRIGPKIFIEKEDAESLVAGQNATFINWGNLMINKIEREDGAVVSVKASLNLEDKNYKNTLKITWLAEPVPEIDEEAKEVNAITCYAVYFDHIMSVPILGKNDEFKDFVAKDTRKEVRMLGEVELKRVKVGEIIQLQRKGFFRCDVSYAPVSPYSNRIRPVVLFHIPDGHMATSKNPTSDVAGTATTPAPNTSDRTQNGKQNINNALDINGKIIAQGDKVRRLKTDKADKAIIDAEVTVLKALKTEYKASTGEEWKPGIVPKTPVRLQNQDDKGVQNINNAFDINEKIVAQGDKVRRLKTDKADKTIIDAEVTVLKALKTEYKASTGEEWKPGIVPKTPALPQNQDGNVKISKLSTEITQQHDRVAELQKLLTQESEKLQNLKTELTKITGKDCKLDQIQNQDDKTREQKSNKKGKGTVNPEAKVLGKDKSKADCKEKNQKSAQSTVTNIPELNNDDTKVNDGGITNAEEISNAIQKQGDKVRNLKGSKADKAIVNQEVKILLSLKDDYKNATGQDWKPAMTSEAVPKKKKEEQTPKSRKTSEKEVAKGVAAKDIDTTKTGTRLGLEAKKEENFFDWYSQIITKSEMIEYYNVSGCYTLRPWSYTIWKTIKNYIDKEITALGVQECYFPIFVTRSVLEKEKAHIADFAPEVAWVTKCGESDLAEPIAIRPTSETVMYPAYAKWLRSDPELPLKLNQWNNVVRWEFKDPKPFLRTREFLWQEGHTAFATKTEAEEEVLVILDMYARVYEELLAVPVIKGRKTEKEKFAGGDYTTTVEAFISTSGRAIQGATSHHLGQNFSKMFNIQVEGATEGDEKTFVYQNSWGLTTRTIGVMVMVHGDDKGLVLPPNVAGIQGIVVPCGITASTSAQQRKLLQSECVKLVDELSNGKFKIKGDFRDNRTPGWKFNHWELKGVPVRIELGPKDLQKNQVTFVRRDNFQRLTAKRNEVTTAFTTLLDDIQASLLNKARENLNTHIKQVDVWDNFVPELNKKNLLLSPFCGEAACEDNIKTDSTREDNGEEPGASMGAKSLCIPFEQPKLTKPLNEMKCVHHSCRNKPKFYTLFGRSY